MIARRRYDLPKGLAGTIREAISRDEVVNGPHGYRFDRALKLAVMAKGPVRTTSSGRVALSMILDAMRLPPGAAVMIPAYTLGALRTFLERRKLRPVVCDVAKDRPIMTPETIDIAWQKDVKVVLATHLFGWTIDMAPVMDMAERRGAFVVEDCAHAMGARHDHRPAGSLGHAAFLSFDVLKPINTFGGGAVLAMDTEVAERITQTASLDAPNPTETLKKIASGVAEDALFAGPWLKIPTGLLAMDFTRPAMDAFDRRFRRPVTSGVGPTALSDLQARIGLEQMGTLASRLARRRKIARAALSALDINDPRLDETNPDRGNAYFTVVRGALGENTAHLRRSLWMAGIDAGIGGEVADVLSLENGGAPPNAQDWYDRAVQLPCYSAMGDETIEKLQKILTRFKGRLVS